MSPWVAAETAHILNAKLVTLLDPSIDEELAQCDATASSAIQALQESDTSTRPA